jgi:hypothetical protein
MANASPSSSKGSSLKMNCIARRIGLAMLLGGLLSALLPDEGGRAQTPVAREVGCYPDSRKADPRGTKGRDLDGAAFNDPAMTVNTLVVELDRFLALIDYLLQEAGEVVFGERLAGCARLDLGILDRGADEAERGKAGLVTTPARAPICERVDRSRCSIDRTPESVNLKSDHLKRIRRQVSMPRCSAGYRQTALIGANFGIQRSGNRAK